MDLQLIRKEFTQRSTIGELSVDGKFECYTLEDMVRPVKIKGMTAIPAGAYEVVVTFSERFQRLLPLLLNVPGFDGVRIHTGNTEHDTEGCILVGKVKKKNMITYSKAAFNALFSKIHSAAQREKMFIHIIEERIDTQ
jgi:hypothetical protein